MRTKRAVERNIEIIGEALAEFKKGRDSSYNKFKENRGHEKQDNAWLQFDFPSPGSGTHYTAKFTPYKPLKK